MPRNEETQVVNASDNAPFDDGAWRREYMRTYVRKQPERARAVYDEKKQPAEDELSLKERKPPPKGERKARWAHAPRN